MRIISEPYFTCERDRSLETALARYNEHYDNAIYTYLASSTEIGITLQDAALELCGSLYHDCSIDHLYELMPAELADYWLLLFDPCYTRQYAVMIFVVRGNIDYSYVLPHRDAIPAYDTLDWFYHDVLCYSDKITCESIAQDINSGDIVTKAYYVSNLINIA